MGKKILHFVYYQLATCFGAGFSPVAPGTVGSLVTLIFVAFLYPANPLYQLLLALVTLGVGIYVSNWMAEAEGEKDPSSVVIDEVAGMLMAFILIPQPFSWQILLAGFLIFRILDIYKPGPVGKLEALPGGFGIMMDDVLAGLMTNVILQIAIRVGIPLWAQFA